MQSNQGSETPVKILLIAPPMHIVGGQSVQAERIFRCLKEAGAVKVTFQPTVLRLRPFNVNVGSLRYVRTVLNTIAYLFALLFRIPRNQLIHVFTAGDASFLLIAAPALLLSRLCHKKVILHYHDGRALSHFENWPGTASLCRLADVIVTPTTFLVDVFGKFGLRARPIANVLEAGSYPFRLRKKPRPLFFHNRGHEKEYNVQCTLRAFAEIQNRYPQARLVIANDGTLRRDLEEFVRTLRLRNVTFTGAVSQQRIRDLYNAADIYLSSADYDNMPGSVLEAFAAGLPVIATRAGGTGWLVRDQENGFLTDCGDHHSMAQRAFQLLEEDGLAERLTLTAWRDLTAYSWANVGWKWVDLYLTSAAVTRKLPSAVSEASEWEF